MLEATTHVAAQFLVHRGVLDPEQLQAALRLRTEWPSLSLTDLLLMFGFVSYGRLAPVLAELHPEQHVGRELVRDGWLTALQLDEALAIQEETGGELASILEALGHCSSRRFERVREQCAPRPKRRGGWNWTWQPRLA